MPELIAKANEAILEAQWLRRERRLLRFEASVLVSRLGATVLRSQAEKKQLASPQTDIDHALWGS
jgi:hypothetical protein